MNTSGAIQRALAERFPEQRWTRSSRCSGANSTCVEVALCGGTVRVRDGKDPAGPVLVFSADEWRAFEHGVLAGEFNL